MKTNTSLILTVAILALSGSALAEVKIALVAKSLGNGFFEAANVGAQEAAKELGDVKVIYTGPTTTTAEAQIEVLNVEKGDVAILSATPTSTNQNIWIEEMKKVLPQYPSVNLVTVAYGDDLSDKSYREAVGLLQHLFRGGR